MSLFHRICTKNAFKMLLNIINLSFRNKNRNKSQKYISFIPFLRENPFYLKLYFLSLIEINFVTPFGCQPKVFFLLFLIDLFATQLVFSQYSNNDGYNRGYNQIDREVMPTNQYNDQRFDDYNQQKSRSYPSEHKVMEFFFIEFN